MASTEGNLKSPSDTDNLSGVSISDDDLEQIDKLTKEEQKEAGKRAKLLRTPEEKKRAARKKFLIALSVAATLLALVFAIPATRWGVLNTLGFRNSTTLLVQEGSTFELITQATAYIDGSVVGTTDSTGQLVVSGTRLGNHELRIEKPGYSSYNEQVAFGLKDGRLDVSLESIGVKITATMKDWLTNAPIARATIAEGKNKSISDKDGNAVIIVPPGDEEVTLTVSAPGYKTRKVAVDPKVVDKEVTLVSSAKNYFISKRDGNFDIFSSDLDGTNQKKIIEATGKEDRYILQFLVHSSNKQAVLVATREGLRENDRLVAGVYKVDLEKATLTKLDEGSDVQLLGWAGDHLIYTKTIPSLKYNDKNLTRLVAYDAKSSTTSQIAQTNYFQLALVAGEKAVYMPGDAYRELKDTALISYEPSTDRRASYLKDQGVSYGTQTSYGGVQLETAEGRFFELNTTSGLATPIDRQPGQARVFALSPNRKQVVYADRRDGKGALIVQSTGASKEKVVAKISGLTDPVRWISNNLVVARIATNQETADYVVDIQTGKYAKISDVSHVGLLGQTQL